MYQLITCSKPPGASHGLPLADAVWPPGVLRDLRASPSPSCSYTDLPAAPQAQHVLHSLPLTAGLGQTRPFRRRPSCPPEPKAPPSPCPFLTINTSTMCHIILPFVVPFTSSSPHQNTGSKGDRRLFCLLLNPQPLVDVG